jgi:alginate O-acetyltransferase complex protein AlgI
LFKKDGTTEAMLFNSLEFLVFFPLIVLMYYISSNRSKWITLLLGSYFFYMWWNPAYILLIVISTLIDYVLAIVLENCSGSKRKLLLGVSIATNLGILFIFKYYDFFSSSLASVMGYIGLTYDFERLDYLLPIGISFYTFQTMSYSIDVYRKKRKAEKHLGYFALYVAFFPQLVAGPIERSHRLIPQLKRKNDFDREKVSSGLKLMGWGFFKKVVIADRIAVIVNTVYSEPSSYNGFQLSLGAVCFAYQLYCDFSGYSDIAIGAARVMGIDLMENFRRPFLAASVKEFWERWHISLTSWFRDYVSIPLNRKLKGMHRFSRQAAVILITFVLSGLWHGASWTFVIWGLIQGIYLIIGKIRDKLLPGYISPFGKAFRIVFTFMLVTLAAVFFRASSVSEAVYVLTHLHIGWEGLSDVDVLLENVLDLGISKFGIAVAVISICFMETVNISKEIGFKLSKKPVWLHWAF